MSLIKSSQAHVPTFRSLLSDLFETDSFFGDGFFRKDSLPSVNIKDNDSHYEIDIAAPGLKKDDFKLEVERGVLTISGENKAEKEEKDKKYTRREFSYQSFSRSFALPDNADENAIEAKYENGILKLNLKKTKSESPVKKVIHLN